MNKNKLLQILELEDAFATPTDVVLPYSPGGNNDAAIHENIVRRLQPELVIEVGSWKGSSAISTAKAFQKYGLDATLICVDTWLGGMSQWTNKGTEWSIHPFLKNGFPVVYYQFLVNIIHAGVQPYILPIPNTSVAVARFLKEKAIQTDLIYLDGSHEYHDVYTDLTHYFPLLKEHGVIWGDDWHIHAPGVVAAVTRFSEEKKLKLVTDAQFNKWFLLS